MGIYTRTCTVMARMDAACMDASPMNHYLCISFHHMYTMKMISDRNQIYSGNWPPSYIITHGTNIGEKFFSAIWRAYDACIPSGPKTCNFRSSIARLSDKLETWNFARFEIAIRCQCIQNFRFLAVLVWPWQQFKFHHSGYFDQLGATWGHTGAELVSLHPCISSFI